MKKALFNCYFDVEQRTTSSGSVSNVLEERWEQISTGLTYVYFVQITLYWFILCYCVCIVCWKCAGNRSSSYFIQVDAIRVFYLLMNADLIPL